MTKAEAVAVAVIHRTWRHPFPQIPTRKGQTPDRVRRTLREVICWWNFEVDVPPLVPYSIPGTDRVGYVLGGNQDSDAQYSDGCVHYVSMGEVNRESWIISKHHVGDAHGWTL